MTATPPATPPSPPTDLGRALAPDLARGAALLLIAVANAHLFLHGHGVGVRGYPPDPGPADRVIALVQVVLVDGRAYPLFGALVGYGLVRLGDPALVRRRSRWLVVIGAVHAALLFSGDIVGVYGLLGLLLGARVVAGHTRTWRSAGWLAGPVLAGALLAAPVPPEQSALLVSMTVTDPVTAVGVRLVEWVAIGIVQAAGVAAAVLIGAVIARRGLLDAPAAHLRTLRRTAVIGLGVATLGGAPLALMAAGLWPDPSVPARLAAGALHGITGYGGGLAYLALAALVAGRVTARPGRVTTAVVACGRRSLTCYLAQSVGFVAVLAPYGGGWGDRIGLAGVTVLAVLTWVATVIGADLLRRAGYRGPAEVWLRRRTRSSGPSGRTILR